MSTLIVRATVFALAIFGIWLLAIVVLSWWIDPSALRWKPKVMLGIFTVFYFVGGVLAWKQP